MKSPFLLVKSPFFPGFYQGFPMVFPWFSYGFPMVFAWFRSPQRAWTRSQEFTLDLMVKHPKYSRQILDLWSWKTIHSFPYIYIHYIYIYIHIYTIYTYIYTHYICIFVYIHIVHMLHIYIYTYIIDRCIYVFSSFDIFFGGLGVGVLTLNLSVILKLCCFYFLFNPCVDKQLLVLRAVLRCWKLIWYNQHWFTL